MSVDIITDFNNSSVPLPTWAQIETPIPPNTSENSKELTLNCLMGLVCLYFFCGSTGTPPYERLSHTLPDIAHDIPDRYIAPMAILLNKLPGRSSDGLTEAGPDFSSTPQQFHESETLRQALVKLLENRKNSPEYEERLRQQLYDSARGYLTNANSHPEIDFPKIDEQIGNIFNLIDSRSATLAA